MPGITLDVLPYGGTAPEAILAAHQAECGISFQDSLTFAAAAGADITSVMAILQHTAQDIAVLASSDITRPAELDGRTYAGFGYPNEVPTLQAVIKADGGTGDVRHRHPRHRRLRGPLQQARGLRDHVQRLGGHRGRPARHRPADVQVHRLRVPGLLPGGARLRRGLAGEEPGRGEGVRGRDRARVRVRGGQPGRRGGDPRRGRTPASSTPTRTCRRPPPSTWRSKACSWTHEGKAGTQTLETWSGYSGFLYDQGLLTVADGKPLAAAPDYGSLFTNDFLP